LHTTTATNTNTNNTTTITTTNTSIVHTNANTTTPTPDTTNTTTTRQHHHQHPLCSPPTSPFFLGRYTVDGKVAEEDGQHFDSVLQIARWTFNQRHSNEPVTRDNKSFLMDIVPEGGVRDHLAVTSR
jgi:hypothetical protein